MDESEETERLRDTQRQREQAEEELARRASDPTEAAQHSRRAEKSRYLREKLDERAASEQED